MIGSPGRKTSPSRSRKQGTRRPIEHGAEQAGTAGRRRGETPRAASCGPRGGALGARRRSRTMLPSGGANALPDGTNIPRVVCERPEGRLRSVSRAPPLRSLGPERARRRRRGSRGRSVGDGGSMGARGAAPEGNGSARPLACSGGPGHARRPACGADSPQSASGTLSTDRSTSAFGGVEACPVRGRLEQAEPVAQPTRSSIPLHRASAPRRPPGTRSPHAKARSHGTSVRLGG